MANYTTTATGATLLPGSTPAVLLTANTLGSIPGQANQGWNYGQNNAGTFTFIGPQGTYGVLTLPINTLDGALVTNGMSDPPGAFVLIDPLGLNKWVPAVVTSITTSAAPSGSGISAGSRAVATSSLAGYAAAVVGETFSIAGTSVDGHVWFTSTKFQICYAAALTTRGQLATGQTALIEFSPGQWAVYSI